MSSAKNFLACWIGQRAVRTCDVRRVEQHRIEPRGLSRTESASYIGVCPTLFDQMVKDGRMPQPKRINTRTVWDKRQLDEAFAALPGRDLEEAEDWNVAV